LVLVLTGDNRIWQRRPTSPVRAIYLSERLEWLECRAKIILTEIRSL